jgi:hypothetical protein
MKPEDIQRALDYDLFVSRDKRTLELLALIVTWAEENNPWQHENVCQALEELKELSSR